MFDLEAINYCMDILHIRCSESYVQDIDSQTDCVICSGTCRGNCQDTCYGSCEGDCSGTCEIHCADDCEHTCLGGCAEDCSKCD